jgi:SNF2 family DNA or RNA helicase
MPQPTLYRGNLIVPDDPRVATLIPHAKKIVHEGKEWTVVPHKLDEYKMLRNLGYDIQPPIMTEYQWPIVNGFQPFDAQKWTAAMISVNDTSYVLNDLGTGKTRAALFAYDYLRQHGVVNKLLVVAPLSTLRRTWAQEVLQTFHGMRWRVLHGSADKRMKLLAEDAEVYIINHDGLAIVLPELLARTDIDMVVYDELTAIKKKGTDRWKAANALFRKPQIKRLVGMTGLATPQAPTDAYGQIAAMTPRQLDHVSYSRFRDLTMRRITNFKYLPRHDATETVFRYMQPAIRFTRDQCIDLPPVQYVDYECKLSIEQKKLFEELKREFHAQLNAGQITVQNEADKINKMMQVVTGCVYKADGSVQYLDCAPRLNVLDEIVEATALVSKLIIFAPYKHSLRMIKDHLTSKGWNAELVSGDTPVGQRDEIFRRMQEDDSLRILVAHPACMSHGLTLTSASVIAWWGVPPSVEIYEQANARITRPGQKRKQYIAHIVATTFEVQRYRQLEQRIDTAGLLLSMVKSQQLGEVL